MTATEQTPAARATIDRLVEVLSGRRDAQELEVLLHPEHELLQNLADLRPVVGCHRFAKLLRFYHAALAELSVRVEDEFWDGRACCLRCSVEATHAGPLGMIAPTNARVTFAAFLAFEMLGAVVCRTTMYADGYALLTAIAGIELCDPCPQGTRSQNES